MLLKLKRAVLEPNRRAEQILNQLPLILLGAHLGI